jgi:hypothetical protein
MEEKMRYGKRCHLAGATLVVLAALVMGTACKEENPLAFTTKVTEENLCNEVAEVMCSNVFECCRGQQIEEDFGVRITTSEEDCRVDMTLSCEESTAALRQSLSEGRASLATERINACLKAYHVGKAGCFPKVTEFAPECAEELVKGKQGLGAKCLYAFECGADAYCGSDRKCQAKPREGQDCAAGNECAKGLYCATMAGNVSLCQARKPAGEACTSPGSSSGECAEVTVCRANDALAEDPAADPYVCTPKKPLGASCDSPDICISGVCLPGTCDGDGVCFTDNDCSGTCENNPAQECSRDEECGAVCESSGGACSSQNPCGMVCRDLGTACSVDEDCWRCAQSGIACTSDAVCNPGTDTEGDTSAAPDECLTEDVCVEDACNPTSVCEGSVPCGGTSCGESYITADYCDNSLIGKFSMGQATTGMTTEK